MNWKEIFTPPFIADEYNPGTIWASNYEIVTSPTNLMDNAADNYVFGAERAMDTIVEAMNAKCEGREPKCPMKLEDIKYDGSDNSATVSFTAYGDKMSIEVRGWGLLTGPMKMPPEEAAAIQDAIGQFIVDSVNEANLCETAEE
jgi:hypothetical protein